MRLGFVVADPHDPTGSCRRNPPGPLEDAPSVQAWQTRGRKRDVRIEEGGTPPPAIEGPRYLDIELTDPFERLEELSPGAHAGIDDQNAQ